MSRASTLADRGACLGTLASICPSPVVCHIFCTYLYERWRWLSALHFLRGDGFLRVSLLLPSGTSAMPPCLLFIPLNRLLFT